MTLYELLLDVHHLQEVHTWVFGIVVSGVAAASCDLLIATVELWLGVGLWRLYELARRVAIGLACYTMVLVLLDFLNHDSQRSADLAKLSPGAAHMISLGAMIFRVTIMIFMSIEIWFLIKRKSAFVKPVQSA